MVVSDVDPNTPQHATGILSGSLHYGKDLLRRRRILIHQLAAQIKHHQTHLNYTVLASDNIKHTINKIVQLSLAPSLHNEIAMLTNTASRTAASKLAPSALVVVLD